MLRTLQRFSRSCLAGKVGSVVTVSPSLLAVERRGLYAQVLCAGFHNSPKMSASKIRMADRLKGTDKNVWVDVSREVVETKSLNLGQGFPDFFPPQYIRDALAQAVLVDNVFANQYTRSYGHPRLIKALSTLFSPMLNHDIQPMEEVLITVGAYGALFCAVQGLINPGDEAIIIEPYFDCYEPMVKVAGGVPVFVPLRPTKTAGVTSSGDWKLDPEELASKFTSKTKAIFLNNPNNPLGKVFTLEELEMIGALCKKHDVIIIADEVYEWLTYHNHKCIKMASLPGMWERTITVGSAGKTFSVTGWKLGWAMGPKHLIFPMQIVHQNCIYTCPTPIQEAVALGFEIETARQHKPESYFNSLAAELQPKRDRMAKFLKDVGLLPIIPEGGYFMMADFTQLGVNLADDKSDETLDVKFNKWLMRNKKLGAIPPSVFFCQEDKHLGENYIRLCFCKDESTLDKAEEIFRQWKATL